MQLRHECLPAKQFSSTHSIYEPKGHELVCAESRNASNSRALPLGRLDLTLDVVLDVALDLVSDELLVGIRGGFGWEDVRPGKIRGKTEITNQMQMSCQIN